MITEVLVSLFLVWFVRYVITIYLKRKNMPPGPLPYPFIGNIPQMMCDPVNPFTKLAEKYGDIFTVTFPSGNAVVLNTVSLVRDARLGRKEDLSGKSPESFFPMNQLLDKGIATADYSPVYQFRKRVFVSALHVFGAGVEQASERARNAVNIAIEEIESKQGHPFTPKNILESSIMVELWEWLTSKRVTLNDPTIKDLGELGEIFSRQAFLATLYQLFPFLSCLPTQFRRDIIRAKQLKKMIFPPEFQAHMETYTTATVRDLTDSFINSYNREIAKETAKDIGSMDDIPGLMIDVAIPGSDTTSTSLTWFLLYMVLHPDIQDKIHKEIDLVVGGNHLPCWNDLQNMPYMQAVLCEVQRSSGMIVVTGTNATRHITIAGYHIPKGTFVVLNLSKIHHDEQEWPEPEKFKPERFLDSDGRFVGWSKFDAFLPFSIGRRECPGQSLAKIMMFTFASMLLHRFKFELPEGAEIPTTEVSDPALIMRPKDFKIVAKRRNDVTI